MRVVKKIYLVFFGILLFSIVILWFFLVTNCGTYLIFKSVIPMFSGLRIGSLSGNWFNGIRIQNLCYEVDGVLIRGGELYISLDFRSLLKKGCYIDSLFFKDFSMFLEVSKFNISLIDVNIVKKIIGIVNLYSINIHNIVLNNIYIKYGDNIITLNECNTGCIWDKKKFILSKTFFSGFKLLSSNNFNKSDLPFLQTVSLKKIFTYKCFLFDVVESLLSKYLLIKNNFEDFVFFRVILERVEGEDLSFFDLKNFFIKKFCIQGIISENNIQLMLLDIISPCGEIHINGCIRFNEKCLINLLVTSFLNFSSLNRERIDFSISGSFDTMFCITSNFSGIWNGHMDLIVELFEVGPPTLSLTLDIDSLYCSLIDGVDFLIQGLHFNFNGNYSDYRMVLRLVVLSSYFPSSSEVIMNGIGNVTNLIISDLTLKNSKTVINMEGIVNFQDCVGWNIRLIFKKINIIQCAWFWPVNLFGEMNIQGKLSDNGYLSVQLFNFFLYGMLNNCHPIDFQCSFIKNISTWIISKCFLSVGSNILKFTTSIKDNFVISAMLECSSLYGLFPNCSGSVLATINIFQSFSSFKFIGSMVIKSFYWMDNCKIDRIILKYDLSYYDILQGVCRCELDSFVYPSIFLSKLICEFVGSIEKHNIELIMSTNWVDIIMIIHGSFNYINENWYGNILRIDCVRHKVRSNYFFDKKFMFFYYGLPKKLTFFVNDLNDCIFQIGCSNSLEGRGITRMIYFLKNFSLKIKYSFFLSSIDVSGRFIFNIDLILDKFNIFPKGKVYLSGEKIRLIYSWFGETSFISFDNFVLNIIFDHKECYCDWLMNSVDCGQSVGWLKVLFTNKYECLGNVYIKNISLLFLSVFLDSYDITHGIVNIDLKFSGDFICPKIYGKVELVDVLFQGDQVPFTVTSSKVLLNFFGCYSILDGVIETIHGKLYLIGDIHWDDIYSLCVRIHMSGHDVKCQLSSMMSIDVSPNIIFNITPIKCTFKGTLDIPCGNIRFKEYLKHKSDISSDEVIIPKNIYNRYFFSLDSKTSFLYEGTIIVRFGNDVRISIFGLDAKIYGNLEIIQDRRRWGLKGCVSIPKGNFNAYGQSLLIKSGQLLFSGLSGNQPYLNIEAVYQPPWLSPRSSCISNVRITGFITSPIVEFVTDYRCKGNSVFYLLNGQRLDILHVYSNDVVRSFLIKLGLVHVNKFIGHVGKVLGVRNLSLDTFGFGHESQIVFSGYVAPGLQIKYGIGIFDSSVLVTVRYNLFPDFYLEVISGVTQTFDIMYSFRY